MDNLEKIQKDLENNVRLAFYQYILEVGFADAVKEFYKDVKTAGEEEEFFFKRFFDRAREAGYLE